MVALCLVVCRRTLLRSVCISVVRQAPELRRCERRAIRGHAVASPMPECGKTAQRRQPVPQLVSTTLPGIPPISLLELRWGWRSRQAPLRCGEVQRTLGHRRHRVRDPVGKCYLSQIIDCFDGMPISTSPSAELANLSLLQACALLREGEHPHGRSLRPRRTLPLAGIGGDLRGERHRAVDVAQGLPA